MTERERERAGESEIERERGRERERERRGGGERERGARYIERYVYHSGVVVFCRYVPSPCNSCRNQE